MKLTLKACFMAASKEIRELMEDIVRPIRATDMLERCILRSSSAVNKDGNKAVLALSAEDPVHIAYAVLKGYIKIR